MIRKNKKFIQTKKFEVKSRIHKRKISKSYDFSFATMYNEYPKILHENIGAPGIYIRKANNKVLLKDGTTGEMDSSYIIGPDGKTIFELMVVNGEHQSTHLTLDKLKMIGNYSIQQIHDENMPQLSYVVTHIPKDRHVQFYEQTPSQIIKPLFIILDEEKIMKN